MGIELKDAMNIYPFSEATLIAGHSGIGREVVSANIQEVPYVDRWLKGGEILFTAGYAFQSWEKGCEMMERLDKVGIAALAIKPGQYLAEIPPEMIACANQLGLPLFELPQDLPYMDCIIAIFERVTQEQLSVMRRAEKIHDMLTETILNKEGLEGICTILNRVTSNPVFIMTGSGSMLAYKTTAAPEDDPGEGEYLETMRTLFDEYFARAEDAGLKQNQCNIVSPIQGVRLIVVPIFVQDKHLAHLALDMTSNELVDMDLIAFEQASSMVAVELLNEQALWQQEQKIREQLLEDLIMKRYSDEKMIIQRGRHLGFDMTAKYCLFVIDADAFEEALKNNLLGASEDKVQQIKSQVQGKIRAGMERYPRPCLILDSSVGVRGMISVRREEDVQECAAVIDGIIAELKKLNTNLNFSAGVGRMKQGIQHVGQAQREALLAMRAGRSLHYPGAQKRTHSFAELGCLCFLCELSNSSAMRDFYEENMRALIEYDQNNNAELLKTLECYFVCKQNLRKTAEMLFVHKNSVIYRLNKIEALLEKKLDNHQAAFDLQLCFKLGSIL